MGKAPTTIAPTTKAPTTIAPTTIAPTTKAPTTIAPTTIAPTAEAPTTKASLTKVPTTSDVTTNFTGNTTTKKPRKAASIIAEVTMEFDADFDAIVTKFSLEILQDSMKNAIVLVLNVEEWRVQNVTCRNGSIITTFRLLPPDEDINDDAIVVFNKDLDTLRGLVAR